MSTQLSQVVASRLNMQPALISSTFTSAIVDSLHHLATADSEREDREQQAARSTLLATYGYEPSSHDKPFAYADGIAFIPITGLLINRFSSSWGWVTGYNYIRSMVNAACEDDDVSLIVFDCNSGGGEAAGCFELSKDIFATREIKPSLAVVDSASYSACYALASAASKIVVAPSGGVGSIGVVAMHVDMSKLLNEYGYKITFIYSGDHKVDGNSYEPLPSPVRKSIQARVDSTRNEFVSLVATNRGIDEKTVFDTQAQCYSASDALDLKLVDGIATPLDAVKSYLLELSGDLLNNLETQNMKQTDAKVAESSSSTTTATTTTAATATEAAATTTATTTTEAAASTPAVSEREAERARIKAITTHAAAADRPKLANHLAMDGDLSADVAIKILEAAAPEKKEPVAEAGQSAFTAAMETSEHPNVGADTSSSAEMTAAQRILKSQALASGATH